MRPVLKPHPEDLPFLRRLAWTVAIACLLIVTWRAANLLLLAFGSVLGAVAFRSAARLFQRIGVSNERAALGLGIGLVLAILGLIGWLLVAQFGSEIGAMLEDLPATIGAIERTVGESPVGRAVVQAVRAAAGGGTIATSLANLTQGAGEVLLNFLIVLVGAMFFAGNPKLYLSGIVLLTPPPARAAMEHALEQVSRALGLWLKAKIMTMAVMTVLIGGGLWWAGMKSWAALALLGGLSEFVPYVGPAMAMVPAVALAATGGSDLLWRTVAAYAVIRLFEAYALTPFITRKVVRIPAAVTLFTILAAGAVFGVYGLFFAGALLVVFYVGVREFYLRDTLGEEISGLSKEVDEKAEPQP